MSDFVLGLTGGIGSGKSAVAEMFVAQGIVLVDTDALAHELTGAGGAAMRRIRATFGEAMAAADGALDRARMRRLVFSDPAAKARLEGILHPLIRGTSARLCRDAASPYVVLAVPLLVESGTYRARCDRIAVVDCPESLQVSRVMARSGLGEAEVRAIMDSQATRAERLAIADDVIANETDLGALRKRVAQLHREYLVLATEKVKVNR